MTTDTASKQRRGDIVLVFIALLGTVVAFINIYHAAQRQNAGNAVAAGVVLFAFAMMLTLQLAKMRSVSSSVHNNKGGN